MKSVSASGAMTVLLGGWLKVSRTDPSTKSTMTSMRACVFVGWPIDAFLATRLKNQMSRAPSRTAKNIESTFSAQKLPWHSFQTQAPSFLQTVRFWRW